MANAQTPPARVTLDNLSPETFLPPVPAWGGASEALIAKPGDAWITPSEKTGLTASPNYADTVAFLRKMDRQSALMRIEEIGITPEGRALVAARGPPPGAGLGARAFERL